MKLYYTIGEVAELLEVTQSQLRYWENEFAVLNPKKITNGDRRYTQKDLETIQTIIYLVKEKGYTIDGAKKAYQATRNQDMKKKSILQTLNTIKGELLKINNRIS